MPSTNCSPTGPTSFNWSISGLSNPFNTSFYTTAALFNAPFTNGQSTQPSGLVSSQSAPSVNSSTSTNTISVSGATSAGNSYTLYGGVRTVSGDWFTCGSNSFTSLPNSLSGLVSASRSATYAPANVTFSWSNPGGATGYTYSGAASGTTTLTSLTLTNQSSGSYSLTVTPTNAGGSGGSGSASISLLVDTTPPSLTIGTTPGDTFIDFTWSSSDSESGFNRLDIYMSGPGGGTLYNIGTTFTASGTDGHITADGLGNPLNAGTLYALRFVAQDRQGNETTIDRNVTTTTPAVRPSNFAWSTSKVSGGNFNLTATEWQALLDKIQQFRAWKGMSAYSWTYNNFFSSGFSFTANMFNEVRTAIASMSPPTSPPSSVSSGQDVLASYLNGLRDSLNSIP